MSEPSPKARPLETVDVPTGPGGQTLRVARMRPEEGDEDVVLFLPGFGATDGREFHRPSWAGDPLRIPASRLGELREALEVLEAEE